MTEFGAAHGRIKLDEDGAGAYALTVADMDCAHDAGLERLDGFGSAARDDPARCDRDNVDRADARPGQGNGENSHDAVSNGAASRGRGSFDDLQRGRQEGELIRVCVIAIDFMYIDRVQGKPFGRDRLIRQLRRGRRLHRTA